MAVKNIYVHVPFCVRKCLYCDFYSTGYNRSLAERYVRAVAKELETREQYAGEIKTLYIGGGTPTALDDEFLEELLSTFSRKLKPGPGTEFTIEANPVTLSPRKIGIMKRYGVNRVSLGVQSFSDDLLSILGRVHDSIQAEEAVKMVSGSFENFSLDLIYGIPGQNMNSWKETLQRALKFHPPHISLYELTPERGTPLFSTLQRGELRMPDEDTILEMYRTGTSVLGEKGYRHYEISNYALQGHESRHNINYWRRGEYIGLGPSAHSFAGRKRWSNLPDVNKYCEAVESGANPSVEEIALSPADERREFIFLGLRTAEGVSLDEVPGGDFGLIRDFIHERLAGLIERGLVSMDGERIFLTEGGFPLSNPVIVEIMSALGL